MALLFLDGFDHYATADIAAKWTAFLTTPFSVASSIAAAGGRRGSGSFRLATSPGPTSSEKAGVQKVLTPADATCVAGLSFVLSNVASIGTVGVGVISVRDAATAQVTLRLNQNLTLSVLRGSHGGTVLGTTAAALAAGVVAYLELKTLIDPSAGTVDLRINGVSASPFPLTAQNTRNTANTSWNSVALGSWDAVGAAWNASAPVATTLDFDDLYVLDGSGAAPWTTFLGDCRVDARYPTGAGTTTGWTPSAGANWAAVDETAPNGDTDYVAATGVVTDTYVTQDAPVVGATIYGVQHCVSMKKSDAGTCTVAPVIRHSGVDYPGADLSPGTAYAYGLQIAAVNPGTGAAWTEAGFNAAEFGVKRTG